jgi:amino acid transporter
MGEGIMADVGASAGASGGLRRVLSFRTVVSTSTGLAYAAISLFACIQLAAYLAGDAAWVALLIAGGLAVLAALCFSELNALYPSAAAIRQYMRAALNEGTSLTISYAYVLTIVAVIAADSFVVGSAISFAFAPLPVVSAVPTVVWVLIILALATGANLLGIRIAGLLQDLTTYALLVSLAAISLIALAHGGFQLTDPVRGAFRNGPLNLIQAVAVGIFVFSAFEWVTPLAEEVTDSRMIPRGMLLSLGLLFVSYALFTVAATHLVGLRVLCPPASQPSSCVVVPQMLLGRAALGQAGVWWMLLATLFTGVMTFNGGFATASRFLYAAAREATLPRVFARLSLGRAVPWVGVVALAVASAVVAVVIFLTQEYIILTLVGAVLEALIYAVAGLCVIQLRRRQPRAARSFRIAGGWTIPIVTIAIFTLLGLAAGVTANTSPPFLPLLITLFLFALSFLYVWLVVPRLKAAEVARTRHTGRRRPVRPVVAAPLNPPVGEALPASDEPGQ